MIFVEIIQRRLGRIFDTARPAGHAQGHVMRVSVHIRFTGSNGMAPFKTKFGAEIFISNMNMSLDYLIIVVLPKLLFVA